eukprot:jgi/Botrbrau1/11294/Bobra.0038s0060.1
MSKYSIINVLLLILLQFTLRGDCEEQRACRAAPPACDAAGPRISCGDSGSFVSIPANEGLCQSLGCCWSPPPPSPAKMAAANLASCFQPNGGSSVYALKGSLTTKDGVSRGVSSLAQGTMPILGADVEDLTIETKRIASDILEVTIGPPTSSRWQIPGYLFERTAFGGGEGDTLYDLEVVPQPLGFAVSRKGSNDTVFDTRSHRLIFKNQYLEISTSLEKSTVVYGLGESAPSTGMPLRRDGVPYTLWAHDTWAGYYDINNYGSHPFYMGIDSKGQAHGVLMWNSNGMDVGITEERLQYRVIGGLLDLFVFLGPTPADVMTQFSSVVGRPHFPPYWAMGFMNSKYGYNSVEEAQEVVDNYTRAGIPLEVFISDSQYMNKSKLFTLDPATYPANKMQAFIEKLHKNGQRWVPILEPGVLVEPGYELYESGMKAGIFIKDYTREQPSLGVLWPGASYYPDFLANQTEDWWHDSLQGFAKVVPFDGIWLDMTEPTSFCNSDQCRLPQNLAVKNAVTVSGPGGEAKTEDWKDDVERLLRGGNPVADNLIATLALNATGLNQTNQLDMNDLYVKAVTDVANVLMKFMGREQLIQLGAGELIDIAWCPYACSNANPQTNPKAYALSNPPYQINSIDGDKKKRVPLNYRTVPVSAWHLNDISAYDAHNLYGHSMSRATYRSLTRMLKARPFILSRSTFVGSGAYTAHWTGDIKSSWEGLRSSIAGIMTDSLAGIPFTGADICGFNDHATEELCARWIAAGAFYPLSRDHHSDGYQELYRWEKVANVSRAAISQRYALLPYLYTTLFYSSVTGNPISRPLFFASPQDEAVRSSSYQWMFGDGIMVAPVLDQGATQLEAYFPNGTWYNLRSHASIASSGQVQTVTQAIEEPANSFVAGGNIIAMGQPAMTTREVKASKVSLLVGLSGGAPQQLRVAKGGCISGDNVACGQLYIDDGEQLEMGSSRDNHIIFSAIQGTGGGRLFALFGGNPLNSGNQGCASGSSAAPTVTISDITILGAREAKAFGLYPTNASAVVAAAGDVLGQNPAEALQITNNATLSFDSDLRRLRILGLDVVLRCPDGFELQWH